MLYILFSIFLLLVFLLVGALLLTYRLWRKEGPGRAVRRGTIVLLGVLLASLPYLHERRRLLSFIPVPLEVASVEYKLEKLWGLGFMPGDNETGFIVYRLTDASTEWARKQGSRLGEVLPGGASKWLPTLVSGPNWPSATPQIEIFLDEYGFIIPVEKGRLAEADQAIQHTGSYYSYGDGGSVTIVDPIKGKIYFAYRG